MMDTDTKATLFERKEQWRKIQQVLVDLGNGIAINSPCVDIRERVYEWSDEALSRSRECGATLKLIDE